MSRARLASFLAIVFLFSDAAGQVAVVDDIDVLFVFDISAYGLPLLSDKNAWVEAHENTVNGFLSASGVAGLRFDFRASTQVIPYNASSKTHIQASDWMGSAEAAAIWKTLRSDNDLIVLVVANYNNNKCGYASRVENEISILNGNSKYFATMAVTGCSSANSRAIAHELGHTLYADHQLLYNQDGTVDLQATETFMDTNVFEPESFNHAWSNVADTRWTLMGTPASLTSQLGFFSTGNTSRGEDPFWHDVIRMFGNGSEPWGPFGDRSWTTVSRYRPILAPKEASNFRIEFIGCNGSLARYAVTWGGSVNYPTDIFKVQALLGSSWYPWYEGSPGCIPHSTTTPRPRFRIKTVSIGGETGWKYATGFGSCDGDTQPF